jgi:hypothetical protein
MRRPSDGENDNAAARNSFRCRSRCRRKWYDAQDATRATVTDVSIDVLLEEVRQALEAEGCFAEIEIVRLFGAAPGERNWEINTIGPNTATPEVRRCIIDVQTQLGEQFQLRSLRREK